jgi:hypothetical protein
MKNFSKQTFLGAIGTVFLLATTSLQAMGPGNQKDENGAHTAAAKQQKPQQAQEQQNANPNGAGSAAAPAPSQPAFAAAAAGVTNLETRTIGSPSSFKEGQCEFCRETIRIDPEERRFHHRKIMIISGIEVDYASSPASRYPVLQRYVKEIIDSWSVICPEELG